MGPFPKIHNIYQDKIVPNRYAEQYELVKIDFSGDKDRDENIYHLRKLSTNEIVLVSIQTLNAFYEIVVNYKGHF